MDEELLENKELKKQVNELAFTLILVVITFMTLLVGIILFIYHANPSYETVQ